METVCSLLGRCLDSVLVWQAGQDRGRGPPSPAFPLGSEATCFVTKQRWKAERWILLKSHSQTEEDGVIWVNLSSCCKSFLNASYHLLLMLSRLGQKPGGFPALSCTTYKGAVLDLFPVIPTSLLSFFCLWLGFFLTAMACCPELFLLGQSKFLWCRTSAGPFNCVCALGGRDWPTWCIPPSHP